MSWLLDTNVVSELMRPRPDARAVAWLDAQEEESLYLSVVTFAELSRGVALLAAGKKRTALARWVAGPLSDRFDGRVLPVDRVVCEAWGALLAEAQRRGRPMNVMDGFIAATAQTSGLTLVTRNVADFAGADLQLANPFA